MSSSNLVRLAYKKETTYGTTPAAVAASKIIQDLTYTALTKGSGANAISIQYANTATAGSETVTVTGHAILVGIQSGTSTATQVRTAVLANVTAAALLSVAVSGVGATAQVTAAAVFLAGGTGEMQTIRFTSEKYSGTPETTESKQIRTDRMSSGQVVTGLKVDGGHNFELAKETALEDFMESAMSSAWVPFTPVTVNLTLSVTGKTLTRATGSFVDEGVVVGDILHLTNFAASNNNVPVQVTAVTSATVLAIAVQSTMTDATIESATYQVADKLTIGTTKKSLTIEKCFTDLTTKALIYRGAIVSSMSLDVSYGNLITGSFDTSGNDYDNADAASEFATYGENILSAATTDTLNGSVDMPFMITNVSGSYAQDTFCIQSIKLKLDANLTTQVCIGRSAPENYSLGTAGISVDVDSYLKDATWDLLTKKITQDAFAVGFLVQKSASQYYGFFLPAIQVSFEDPSSGGQNQDISLNMKGAAKVGSSGESALVIYRTPAA